MIKLYNQLIRKSAPFKPQDPENVKIYTCGPTVYNYAHIGNLCAYVYWDLLVRVLEHNGYQVNRVLNLTDVGHLTSDADEGEDKLEKGAKREGRTVWEVADFYAQAFLKDFEKLNLKQPAKIAKATDFIEQDLKLVDKLTEKGYTYETSDGIYFDTSKFPTYADFAELNLDQLKAGARVSLSSEKRNISDFAVWKFIKPGEDHAMRWQYLGQDGYPGWHLECSTIIHELLGEPIDIHTGGVDHIPVHHSNEIAQSEAAFGVPLARCWLHAKHIMIDGQKISKSLGNTYTLDELIEKGFSPMDFKLWVLQGHYQGERNFSFKDLEAARIRRLNWRNRIAATYQQRPYEETLKMPDLLAAVSNNLNSTIAFSLIDNFDLNFEDWQYIDGLFGLSLIADSPKITSEQKKLIKTRERYRKERDFEKSDALRAELAAQNLGLSDAASSTTWYYLR